jgi:hypothetical protein
VTVPTLSEQKKNILTLPLVIMKRPARPELFEELRALGVQPNGECFKLSGFKERLAGACDGLRLP